MKKNYLKLLCYFFVIMCACLLRVNAASNVIINQNGDLVTVNFVHNTYKASAFYVNDSSSFSSAISFKTAGGTSSTSTGTVSLKNGKYYIWAYTQNGLKYPSSSGQLIEVTGSCKNESKSNQTGSFTVERCFLKTSKGVEMESDSVPFTCAAGYSYSEKDVSVKSNNCSSVSLSGGMSQRYCKVVYSVNCKKNESGGSDPGSGGGTTVKAPSLTSLSVSGGSLSPSFKSGTKSYKMTVEGNVSSIDITAKPASGSSIVSGYGSRTVKLNYGQNKVYVKVKNSAGTVKKYTITVTRKDNRSTVNTLSNIKVSAGELSPAFASGTKNYTVNVDNSVSSIVVDATLTDSKSKFVAGNGPGTFALKLGVNKISLKIKSEQGGENVYTLTVNRATTPTACTTNPGQFALLKGIDLSVDFEGIEIDQIEDFAPDNFVYNDIKVPYKVSNLIITPYLQEDGDSFKIEGNVDLEVNITAIIKIIVQSAQCPTITNEYTLNVTRQPEIVPSSNPELQDITIKGYDFKFEPNTEDYKLTLKKNDNKLDISVTPVDDNTECAIEGNKDLVYGSIIEVKCTAEDGDTVATYTITIDGVEKGTNVVLIVILVIIIIIILIYLVLRLLGYKIYFNTAVIGAFFRGIGEKFRNMFDK